jgi:hypothetical protein
VRNIGAFLQGASYRKTPNFVSNLYLTMSYWVNMWPVDVFCYFLCKTNLPIKVQIWVFLNVFFFVLKTFFTMVYMTPELLNILPVVKSMQLILNWIRHLTFKH